MHVGERVVATMTSWRKRTANILPVLMNLEAQTLRPDKILLNLCVEDYPNKEDDLPSDLREYIGSAGNIEVYWYVENYRGWKKHLHALDVVGDDDLVICLDDDHLMPGTFIEKMYRSYGHYGKRFPITYHKWGYDLYTWGFCGCGTLYRKRDWGDYKRYLDHELLTNTLEDCIINLLFAWNGVVPMPCIYEIGKHSEYSFGDNDSLTPNGEGGRVAEYMRTFGYMERVARKMYGNGHIFEFEPCFIDVKVRVLRMLANDAELRKVECVEEMLKNFEKGDMHFFQKVDEDFVRKSLESSLDI